MEEKSKKIKYIHIAIIILGIIFISISIFHKNLWFDESYSVAIVNHSFSEIWNIGSKDVHPILYYFCLHVLNIFFGNNIIIYRTFSALMIGLLGIIGYTHIRKDFGEKVGILFSFFTLFLPVAGQYAGEIRMYSLGMLLGSLMAIYAYRIYTGNIKNLTYIFFGLSSLLVSYTHYYGLMLAGIINLILFVYLCKNRKTRKKDLIKFVITAVLQVICYMPWLFTFINQLADVSNGFWITLSFPGTIYEILTMQYQGNFSIQPILIVTLFYSYIIFLVSKNKEEKESKIANWCLIIYFLLIIIPLTISLIMQSVILLSRYLIIATGLLIFAIAFYMSKDIKVWRVITICIIILTMSCINTRLMINENYNSNNDECIAYLQSNIQKNDIIVYTNVINGAVITTQLADCINNKSYFYNEENWRVEEPYKAFSPNMEIKDSLEEILDKYTGRIWLIEGENVHKLQDTIEEKYNIKKIDNKQFKSAYKNYSYNIELIEK